MSCSLTPWLDLSYAHVHHHGSLWVMSFDQCCEITAVHLLHVLQIRFTVVGNHLRALLMNIQSTIWKQRKHSPSRHITVNTADSCHNFIIPDTMNCKPSNKSSTVQPCAEITELLSRVSTAAVLQQILSILRLKCSALIRSWSFFPACRA